MSTLFYHLLFLFINLYSLLKVIGYAIYEIKEENNKIGGIVIISFSSIVVLFANIVLFLN